MISRLTFLFVALASSMVLSQDPTPIATTTIGDDTLELFAVKPIAFGLGERESLFPFATDQALAKITGENSFEPWKMNRSGSRENLALGFVLRNAKGEVVNGTLRMATAYRLANETGAEDAYWPLGKAYPISEVCKLRWDYRLAPLVVNVPNGTERIAKLEGAIVLLPQRRTEIEIAKEDLSQNGITCANHVAVAIGKQSSSQGLKTYEFLVMRGTSGFKTETGTGVRGEFGEDEVVIEGIVAGESVQPNRVSSMEIPAQVRRNVIRDAMAKLKDSPQDAAEELVRKIMTDPKAIFTLVSVGFQGDQDFESMVVRVVENTGLPHIRAFEMTNIPISATADPTTINRFVEGLAAERGEAVSSPLAMRTWTSSTGSYSVKAKLVRVDGQVVTIEKEDGKTVAVPIAKLSEDDQRYLSGLGK